MRAQKNGEACGQVERVFHLYDQHGVSQRRACDVLEVDRSGMQYCGTRPDDADQCKAMKDVDAENRRFGYRRIHIMLERQGTHINQKNCGVVTAKNAFIESVNGRFRDGCLS